LRSRRAGRDRYAARYASRQHGAPVTLAHPIERACGRDLSSSAVMNASLERLWRFGIRQMFLEFLSFAETVEINV
jgi:hypothetical protein